MREIADETLREYQELTHVFDESELIGGVYHMDYDKCIILSNDKWKRDAGGVPEHCFLLATSAEWEKRGTFDEDEAYAILLRAQGPAQLTNEQELMEIRQKAMREMITGDDDDDSPLIGSPEQFIDILTQNEIQYSGIEAKILGTFYQKEGELTFGSDIDTFYSAARYAVYKPMGEALSRIASYSANSDKDEGVKIGDVQYSSTQMHQSPNSAEVNVQVSDFIGTKTAVFGMTRTGKSNTMKTIATTIHEHSLKEDVDVGQLLFDPQGEYANPNEQDERALAELGPDAVTVYRFGADDEEEGVEPLQINFFVEENIEAALARTKQELSHKRGTDYIDAFLNVDYIGPSEQVDRGGAVRAKWRRTALHAVFAKAGLEIPDNYREYISVNQNVYDVVDNATSITIRKSRDVELTKSNLKEFWIAVARNQDAVENASSGWIDEDLRCILNMLEPGPTRSGSRLLMGASKFHHPDAEGDYADKIYDDLCDGKIAIVDMSLGLEDVVRDVSDRIVRHIMSQSVERFTANEELPRIQIFLEEAHRLFDRDSYEEGDDPYVRLAKEGAKFKLGLIYATQEVTGVDRRVLANTANWVVTHLNNKNETNRLSEYYNFDDFARATREVEDVGFARVKMASSKYIVPTKIDLFDAERIEHAKRLAQSNEGLGRIVSEDN